MNESTLLEYPCVRQRTAMPENAGVVQLIGQLTRFFSTQDLAQIEWTTPADARVTAYQADGVASQVWNCVIADGRIANSREGRTLETVFNLGSIAHVPANAVPEWFAELARITGKNLWIALPATPDRDQVWWECQAFESGFRKHPLMQSITPYSAEERDASSVLLILEKIPSAALLRYPLEQLRAERDLHMDMLRETGVRSEAHLARYQLAARYAKDADVILDAACGLGYGSAMLARQFPQARIIGIDISEYAVDYARANFASVLPNLEFHLADVCALTMIANDTVDLVVSFETIEHVPEPERFLDGVIRRMKAGAMFIGSVPNLWLDETGKDPNPWHFHVFDLPKFYQLLSRQLGVSTVYRQNAGGWLRNPRSLPVLRPVQLPVTDQLEEAEWWLLVAQKTPTIIAPAQAKPRVWLIDGDTRGHFYTSLRDSLDVEWLVGREIAPERLDLAIVSDEWWWKNSLALQQLKRCGVPTLHVVDGVIDWKNTWENPRSLDEKKGLPLFQPLFADKVACLGQAQARTLSAWGSSEKCEIVGSPRFDRYYGLRKRLRTPQMPVRILIMTANTPYFNEEHHQDIREALQDLRDFFEAAAQQALPIEAAWRLTKGLDTEIGVASTSGGDLAEVLTSVDAVICSPSTALLEAMLLGLPTAVLDYSNGPHYMALAWQISAKRHIAPTIGELVNPSAAKLLFQESVLHDALECSSPAAPRMAQLVAGMIEAGRQARKRNEAPTFPRGMLPASPCANAFPENRFSLSALYPDHSVFRISNQVELQAELNHWRNRAGL